MKSAKINTDLIKNSLQSTISVVYSIVILFALFLSIFFSHFTYWGDDFAKSCLPTVILISIGSIFFLGLYTIGCHFNKLSEKAWNILVAMVFVLLFFIQLIATKSYYFKTDWDVSVLDRISNSIAHKGEIIDEYNVYASMYPNNLLLISILVQIKRIFHSIGLHDLEYYGEIGIQCAINSFVGFLFVKITDCIFKNKQISFLGLGLFFFLIGMSPWISMPYSDSMGLLFPTLILYLYLDFKNRINPYIYGSLLGILTIISYKLKPQLIIVVIAIIILEMINFSRKKINYKTIISAVTFIILSITTLTSINYSTKNLPLDVDENGAYGVTHFFMMGLNQNDMGVWSLDDVLFSYSFDSQESRRNGNIEVIKERINDMGIVGVIKQYSRKMLINYNDGSFCWGGEGDFFIETIDEPDTPISHLFRGLYYKGNFSEIGIYNNIWSNFQQMIWLTVLLASVFSVLKLKDTNKNVIAMSIIGLTIFLTIFEGRARYLYVYAPFYILMALYGVDCIYRLLKKESISLKEFQ